ncbi:MAG: GSCFA domain-containing protein [Bacteroidales bacterium]|jgi:hypothetical protein|nr:GSCFA domain-containing protein [Bacteroidales bacterium]
MKFRTELLPNAAPFKITHADTLCMIGSCFSDNMGRYFEDHEFEVLSNPFGTLYNPASIALALQLAMFPDDYSNRYVCFHDNLWHSFAHHGRFSHPDARVFENQIKTQLQHTRDFLKTTRYLFITFGTSFTYRHIERDFVVANCHKLPAHFFEKKLMSIEEIITVFSHIRDKFKVFNPHARLIYSISPIRHLGDGFHANTTSKALLHIAVNHLIEKDPEDIYFPAYELLLDDLRDYRFYDHDLCHPAENAIEYIREKVTTTFFDEKTIEKNKNIAREKKAKQHVTLIPEHAKTPDTNATPRFVPRQDKNAAPR